MNVIAVIGIDIGKNLFHTVGRDERGAIGLRQDADCERLMAVKSEMISKRPVGAIGRRHQPGYPSALGHPKG